jgi:hypothetical protein
MTVQPGGFSLSSKYVGQGLCPCRKPVLGKGRALALHQNDYNSKKQDPFDPAFDYFFAAPTPPSSEYQLRCSK